MSPIRQGLDGQGTESHRGGGGERDFSHQSRPILGHTQSPIQRISLLEVKPQEHGVNRPSPSSAVVKERVELYLYSPSGPSWPLVV
jgi:hypothetical protein